MKIIIHIVANNEIRILYDLEKRKHAIDTIMISLVSAFNFSLKDIEGIGHILWFSIKTLGANIQNVSVIIIYYDNVIYRRGI